MVSPLEHINTSSGEGQVQLPLDALDRPEIRGKDNDLLVWILLPYLREVISPWPLRKTDRLLGGDEIALVKPNRQSLIAVLSQLRLVPDMAWGSEETALWLVGD